MDLFFFAQAYALTKRLANCHVNFNQPNVFHIQDSQIASSTGTSLYIGQSQGGFLLCPIRGHSKYDGRGGMMLVT